MCVCVCVCVCRERGQSALQQGTRIVCTQRVAKCMGVFKIRLNLGLTNTAGSNTNTVGAIIF